MRLTGQDKTRRSSFGLEEVYGGDIIPPWVFVWVCGCVGVRACVCACVRACVRALRACVRACVRVCVRVCVLVLTCFYLSVQEIINKPNN